MQEEGSVQAAGLGLVQKVVHQGLEHRLQGLLPADLAWNSIEDAVEVDRR